MSKPSTSELDPNRIHLAHEIATRIKPPPGSTLRSLPPPAAHPVWLGEQRVVEPIDEAPARAHESTGVIEVPRTPAGRLFERVTRGAQSRFNGWIVAAYKLVGFAVLTAIVLAVASYLGAYVYYAMSSRWLVPTVIAPTDEHVLDLKTKLADAESARDQVAASLADADRVAAMHEKYLDNARKALTEELASRRNELASLHALGGTVAATRAEVASNSQAWSQLSKERLTSEYDAHVIDRESAVSGALQLSQLAQQNVDLAERELAMSQRRSELIRQADALAAAVSQQPARHHSLDVLRIVQELDRARLELAKATDNRQVLQKSLGRYDDIVRSIAESPYLLAAAHKTTIAFTPYDNLAKVKPGAPLYACSFGLFWCRRVGKVVAVLPGEVTVKHPVQSTMLRGQSVQLELTDAKAAEEKTLFAGRRPLLF